MLLVCVFIDKTHMGQYYKGGKIGTCESMYYMRLEEAQRLAEMGQTDDDGIKFSDYLKDNVTRFRFPFPDEDGMTHGQLVAVPGYDKAFMLPAGGLEVEHGTICVSNTHKGGGHNVNIIMPCPHDQRFRDILSAGVKLSTGGAGELFLGVRFQGIRDGKIRTIFECARCHSLMRFDDAEVEKIKQRSLEYFSVYDRRGKNLSYGGNQGLFDYAAKVIERVS